MATKGSETVAGIASPRGKKAIPNVYTHLGHGSEVVAGEALPVPAGCVYVTFTLCGEVSRDSYRILKAFEDPAVSNLLHDPVKHLRRLTDYFGESLHVHYPEAEDPTSRTYYDMKYNPLLGYTIDGNPTCFSKKSGLFRLGDNAVYRAPGGMQAREVQIDSRPYTIDFPCDNISEDHLKYIYKGSLFPTLAQVHSETDPMEKPITFSKLKKAMKAYKYRQSWAFEKFPGVHYNFICRGHGRGEENIVNSGIKRRRVASGEAATGLLSRTVGAHTVAHGARSVAAVARSGSKRGGTRGRSQTRGRDTRKRRN
jgi:hypothetical protein